MTSVTGTSQTESATAAHQDGRHGVGSHQDLKYWHATCPDCAALWARRWEV